MNHDPLTITSLQNDRIKELVRLRTRRERDRCGLTLIEEPLVISRALDADYPLQSLFFCPERIASESMDVLDRLLGLDSLEHVKVSEPVIDKVSYRDHSEGMLVTAAQSTLSLQDLHLPADPLLVVLESVEKPGNLGAVLRVADGAGAHAVIVCGGGTDLFNPNVMRASRGAFFSVPTVAADTDAVQEFLRSRAIAAVATSPVADHRWDEVGLIGPTAIVLGAEHEGLSPEWLTRADLTVGIPMLGGGDSLNVSTSAAVLLFEAVRQRSPAESGPNVTNEFYNDYDREELDPREEDYRSVFQRGRDRLIHNAAFRRLQAKTQVFLSGEYDFYRTRLTHSIEVAQIAGSIARYLNISSDRLGDDFHIDYALVEAAALAHDIGHPPFGHAGEGTLHRLMKPYGGFEGNAQTLRLITEIIFTSGGRRRGMNPTRAFVDGVLKYKTLFSQWEDPVKHFIYDDQQQFLDFVFEGSNFPADLNPGPVLNDFRSLECQIMDWADDTAYSLNDLVDSANAGFVTSDKINRWAADRNLADQDNRIIADLIKVISEGGLERSMNRKIGAFVEACILVERDNFMSGLTNRYKFGLAIDPEIVREQKLYARLAVDLVFQSPQVCQLEHKGGFMLERLFDALRENYLQGGRSNHALLSRDFEKEMSAVGDEPNRRARIICDYLAGMTDGFAIRIYKRLFDPDFGSIVDLV